ncbi:MAG: Ig domain-containing protein [Patescibacteria group bacterium]
MNYLKKKEYRIFFLGILILGFFAFGFLKDTRPPLVFAQSGKTSSSDAIAIRVITNPDHISISRWYSEQGFKGSPERLIVDGYEALRDGRTVYVNAANIDDKGDSDPANDALFTNIYLISYNQEAEAATKSILDQIISHWKFNTNIADPEQKAKIIRDAKRLSSLAEIKTAAENYKEDKGYYPKLSAGTYLAGKTISTWPSWQQTLAKELGVGLPTDPINKLSVCPGYDSATCWKESTKSFADPTPDNSIFNLPVSCSITTTKACSVDADCPPEEYCNNNSHAFVYTAKADGSEYNVCAIMESGLITTLGAGACAGSAVETVQHGGTATNHPPTITCDNLVGNPNKPFKGYINASDPDGDTLNWSITPTSTPANWTGAGWSSFPELKTTADPNQKEISAATAGNKGIYDFIATVSDNRSGSATKTCYISTIGSARPVITPIADKEIVIGKTLDFTIYATDPGGNYPFPPFSFDTSLISCAITNGHDCRIQSPIGTAFSLTEDGGDNMYKNYPISVNAVNSKGDSSPSQSFNLKVINHKPVVSIPSTCLTKVRIKNAYNSCPVSATDPDSHTIASFSFLPGLPAGMTGNTSTGEISGTPAAGSGGTYNISVTTTDQYGAVSKPKILTLKVNTYCGDGEWQATNGEGVAEKCDGSSNIAATYVGSSFNKQYACDSNCRYTGGWCGDGAAQTDKGEACDKTDKIAATPAESSISKQYTCNNTCQFIGGYCGDSAKNGPEVCDKSGASQDCSSEFSSLPAHCSSMQIEGTQTCNSNCAKWDDCVAADPVPEGKTSTDCNFTSATMNGYACCGLTSCEKDGCDCCGRKCGAETPPGYNNIQWLDPCAPRTTGTSGCTTNASDYSCKINQSTSDPKNWIITTNHTTAKYQCWK